MNASSVMPENNNKRIERKFLLLLFLGFFLIIIGVTILTITMLMYSKELVNFGAVIIIGPIPIVIGAGPESTLMVLFAILLAILCIVVYLVIRRENRI